MKRILTSLAATVAGVFILAPIASSTGIYPARAPTPSSYYFGDPDGDTSITTMDTNVLFNLLAGMAYTFGTLQPDNPDQDWNTCDLDGDMSCTTIDRNVYLNYLNGKTIIRNNLPWVFLPANLQTTINTISTGSSDPEYVPFNANVSSWGGTSGRPGIAVTANIHPIGDGFGSMTTGHMSGRLCDPDISSSTVDQPTIYGADDQCALAITVTDWTDDGAGHSYFNPSITPADGYTEGAPMITAAYYGRDYPYGLKIEGDAAGTIAIELAIHDNGLGVPAITTTIYTYFRGVTINHPPTWRQSPSNIAAKVGTVYNRTDGVATDLDAGQALTCSNAGADCGFAVAVSGSGGNPQGCNLSFTAPASEQTCSVRIQAADNGVPPLTVGQTISVSVVQSFISFRIQATGLDGGGPSADIYPDLPPAGSVPLVPHPGLSIDFLNDDTVGLTSGAVEVVGSKAVIEVSAQNKSSVAIPRAWLVVHNVVGGAASLDTGTATGYIGDGVYYYLGSLSGGATKTLEISFGLSGSVSDFSAYLEVVSVHDRVAFESSQPMLPPELFSIKPDGTDLMKLTHTNNTVYPANGRWSPDGGWVAFSAGVNLDDQVYLARADGGGTQEITCTGADNGFWLPGAFTRDGSGIYVRHYDPVADEAGIYLVNVAGGRNDCADPLINTELVGGNALLPIISPTGDKLIYFRRESIKALPPYPSSESNPTSCSDWSFGSELTLQSMNAYLLPLDPASGLPNGGERMYWENAMSDTMAGFSPDGTGMVTNVSGCAEYTYCCASYDSGNKVWNCCNPPNQTGCTQWALTCNLNFIIPPSPTRPLTSKERLAGIYELTLPTDINDPTLPYMYTTWPGTVEYHMVSNTGIYDEDPSWSAEYNLIVFQNFATSTGRIQLWYVNAADPVNTRKQLTTWDMYNYTGRFMPPP